MINASAQNPSRTKSSARRDVLILLSAVGLILLVGCSTPAERLQKAAARGDVDAAAKILKNGFDPKDAAPQLRMAAEAGRVEIIRLLLDAGVDPNGGTSTALMAAARKGHLEAVRLLVERGADVNRQENAFAIKDLQIISDNGKTVAKFREEFRKDQGNNALSLAIINKHAAIAECLLRHGADTDRRVIYQNPTVQSYVALDSMLGGSFGNVSERSGPDDFTEISVGQGRDRNVTTTRHFEREKTASMKELAEQSGDKTIIRLLSGSQPLK